MGELMSKPKEYLPDVIREYTRHWQMTDSDIARKTGMCRATIHKFMSLRDDRLMFYNVKQLLLGLRCRMIIVLPNGERHEIDLRR